MSIRRLPFALCFPLLVAACSNGGETFESEAGDEIEDAPEVEASDPLENPSLTDLIRRTHFAFRENARGISASHSSHLVEVYGTRIELTPFFPRIPDPSGETPGTPAIPGAAIGLETVDISRGDVDLLDDPGAPELEQDGSVTIPRGPTDEHLDNTEVGVEQSWTLHQAPGGDGDLVVRIEVDGTQGYVTTTDSGLHFEDPISGLGVSYGVATWIDAEGEETTVMPSFEDGHIVIRIPDEVVDASAFPVLLDPVISAENGIDNPVLASAPGIQTKAAMAFGGNQYFAVWYDGRLGQPALYGTRLSAAGHVLDPAGIQISSPNGSFPDVTFDGTNFVVAWGAGPELRAARVAPSGSVLDPDGVVLDSTGDHADVAIAFDGSLTHLVYRAGNDIGRAVVTKELAVLLVDPSVSQMEYSFSPDLACTVSGSCLLVHSSRPDEGLVVTWNGLGQGLATNMLYGMNSPVVAARGTGFVIATRRDYLAPNPGLIDIMTVSAGGQISPSLTSSVSAPPEALVCSSVECALLAGGSSGVVLGVEPETGWTWNTPLGAVYPQSIASSGSDYMAAVSDNSVDQTGDVAVRRITNGIVSQSRVVSTTVANSEASPDVSCDSTQCLAVWEDQRADTVQIYGAFTTKAGSPITGYALPLGCDGTSCEDAESPSVTQSAGRFVTAYECTLAGWYQTLCFTSVEANGAVVYRDAPTASTLVRRPRITAGSNGQLLTVAQTGVDFGSSDVLGVLVDVANGPIAEVVITEAVDDQLAPAVTFDGTNYVVAWEDWRRGPAFGPDVMAARVNASGTVLDPQGFNVSVRNSAEARPAIASDGAGSVVVTWEDNRGGSWDIYGARVSAGSVTDANGISFGTPGTSQQRRPAMAWNGTSYQVVWEDDRNGNGEIYGRQITTGGAMSGGAFGVVTSTTAATAPELEGDGAGSSLLVYQRYVPALGQTRVRAKAITP